MFKFITHNKIKPQGWLLDQLKIQANGLAGNLDKIWPDVKDSKWIGGDREGWERVPYWLDGFIPLAYLLEDEDLIARAEKYVNAIMSRQQEDGWLCPCEKEARAKYDIWAYFLISKVLTVYIEFTGSRKAKKVLYTSLKCLLDELKSGNAKINCWGQCRWFECFVALNYLYKEYKEDWIKELAHILRDGGTDYYALKDRWVRHQNTWSWDTHIVNIGMMFKYEAISCELLGEEYENKAEELWKWLDKYNGTAVGIFTGDECLGGDKNNRGTELCSVVELMYSCELLYSLTGKTIWLDRLEKIAFNALPATISDDMWTHQYNQQANQISCRKLPGYKSFFGTNNQDSHNFGLEPNFGCCTADHGQGWPKLAMSSFMLARGGVVSTVMLPSEVQLKIKGANVSIKLETEYPFVFSGKYTVKTDKAVSFILKIRVPRWAKSVSLNGKSINRAEYINISKCWEGEEAILVEYTDVPHLVKRNYGLKSVEYGPLVFSLPIETEYKMHEYELGGVERKFPYCDYELIPKSEWRYGFADDKFEVIVEKGDNIPFSSKAPRIKLKAKMARVDWDYAEGYSDIAHHTTNSKAISSPEDIELYPYGCAKLRMTEMPFVKK
ncbi:MAG: glycoside hydrolase family 127 protein [Clostridia bacterium]|nr:glycoside hydrolase family 127 protein [Clostridia bacterium]